VYCNKAFFSLSLRPYPIGGEKTKVVKFPHDTPIIIITTTITTYSNKKPKSNHKFHISQDPKISHFLLVHLCHYIPLVPRKIKHPTMTADNKTDKAAGRVLLPSYVQPQSYDLNVKPDLKAYTFDGIVSIEMTTAEDFSEDESKKITLHSKELMFRTAEFQTLDGKVVKADEVSGRFFF
jgi:hypothetical protein